MTQRARRRHGRSRGSVGKKLLVGLAVLVAVLGIAAASAGLWVLNVRAGAPSVDTLKPIDKGESSEVLAADGTRLGYIQSDAIREEVRLKQIPKRLQDATIAIEDENFYEHEGVDYSAVVRAAVRNIEAGEVRQGGSTITQQLVRNLYIANPEETLERKIEEAKMAEEYEQEFSKKRILEEYLNTASYGTNNGRTAVGVEAAAQVYFNKSVEDITLGEAALLAGLPQAPSQYNPFQSEEQARERRNQVLQAMHKEGMIDDAKYADALQQGLSLERGYRYETIREPYFFDYVEQELIDRYGVNTVRQGGLKVHTTIDPALQEAARAAIEARQTTGGPASALVATDVTSGQILAMASSGSYESNQFNLAAQGLRQPGSAFKTFVLTAAVEQGIDPDTTYYNGASPITLEIPNGGGSWTVNNSGGSGGSMSLRSGTVNSVNTVFAQLDLDVGPESVTATARKMGITAPLGSYPAEGIGGLEYGVSPLEMSNAYGTLASGGIRYPPTAISKVEFPDGEVDAPQRDDQERVFSDGVAYEVTDVLKDVVSSGTGTSANYGCPTAGKTGTTELNSDAWFVGYTPKISTAVWVGYPDERISLGSAGFGGTLAAPIWNDFMSTVSAGYCDDFPAPENPADLTAGSGTYTASQSDDEDYQQYDTTTPVTPTTPDDTTEDVPSDDTGGDFDPDLYAPGAGQQPAPMPDGGAGTRGGSP